MPARRIQLQAIGCRLNEAELQAWTRQIEAAGHRAVRAGEDADVVVVNTCAVTSEAARKSRQLIRRARRTHPGARLVVTGCYGTLEKSRLGAELAPDLVVDNASKERLVDLLALEPAPARMPSPLVAAGRDRAFIKVQDGCRYRCSYCIVTIARGSERSRSVADLVAEVRCLVAEGVREVVLTGVHVGGYGCDIGSSLTRLVAALLERTELPRLRLASVEPWDIPDAFFALFSDTRLMPHLHLPLQSGCDTVLRRMARRGSVADYEALLARARRMVPGINVSTDIIAGFPGEGDAEWAQTVACVRRLGFGDLHVFPYSPRAGTHAATLPEQVPAEVARARCRELVAVRERLRAARLAARVGATVDVLLEGEGMPDGLHGYTPDYLRVQVEGAVDSGLRGSVRRVALHGHAEGLLRGRLVEATA